MSLFKLFDNIPYSPTSSKPLVEPSLKDAVDLITDPKAYYKKQTERLDKEIEAQKKRNSTKERQRRNKGVLAFVDSFIDNVIRDMVDELEVGCLVYCDLAFSTVEHTGIYIGSGKIVHLNGDGLVESVSAKQFLDRLDGINTAISIYAPCNDGGVVGSKKVAKRAKQRIGEKLSYHLVKNNCHKFSYECLTGETVASNKIIWFNDLIDTAEEILDANDWRSWKYDR